MRFLALLLLLLLPLHAGALEPVTLQLNWKHQFQFAGYYAALEKGYYREAGLDVRIQEAHGEPDSVTPVLDGRAQYGVGSSNLLLQRHRGRPVVVLAVVIQHSPFIYIARGEVDNVHGLVGKRVMHEEQADELVAYLRKESVRSDQVRRVPHSFSAADLLAGRVDAISAYSSGELFEVRQARMPHTVLTPRSAGIDFYGDNLFTSEQEIHDHPERVRAFREASLRGWRYAMAHPQEIVQLILERYSRRHDEAHLLFEAAELHRLMQPDLVEIGHMNPGRWRHIAEVYQDLEMLRHIDLDGFLYDPQPPRTNPRLVLALVFTAVVSVVLGGTAAYLRSLNLRLRRDEQALREAHAALQSNLLEIQALQSRLQEQALRDALTGLYNRRFMDETLEHELARARREGYALAVVMADVDHFKPVNDTYGHPAGDELLRRLGRLLQAQCREGDVACRYGGEEFMLLLPGLQEPAVRQRAEAWRRSVEGLTVGEGDVPLRVTLSLGIAVFPQHASDVRTLVQRADQALYRAKSGGRNRVVVWADPATVAPAVAAT